MQGTLSTNGNEANATLVAAQSIGNPNHNIGVGFFGSSNLFSGPLNAGAFVSYSKNQHSLSVLHSLTPSIGSSLIGTGSINLYQDPVHRLDASAFHGATKLKNGYRFSSHGGGLNYSHVNGHSAGITASHIPQIGGTTVGVNGTVNLWKSPDQLTRLDMSTGASRTFGGLLDRQNNKSFDLGFTIRF